MIYALWGINDLYSVHKTPDIEKALKQGVISLVKEVEQFNLGWWSKYWIPDAGGVEYISSIMYHALHVAQIKATANLFNEPELNTISDQFTQQLSSSLCRARSAFAFAISKSDLINYLSKSKV
jgi:hypothetical protein